ncbi:RNA polymerase II-associated protein [Dirofilaria immitis]
MGLVKKKCNKFPKFSKDHWKKILIIWTIIVLIRDSCNLLKKLLKRIKRIFTHALIFLSFHSRKNVDIRQCHLPNSSLNYQKAEAEYIEENTVIKKKTSMSELRMVKAKVHPIEQSIAVANCDAAKLVVVTHPEDIANKHPKDNLSNFIFDDNYFEDSWGLHSNLLFASYMRQSLRVATTCNISAKVSRQSIHVLKAMHPEDIKSKREGKYFSSEEFNTPDRTNHNMNDRNHKLLPPFGNM